MGAKSSRHCLLPEDLIIEILLKLPVKSLLRFKSVCKNWHTIITSLNFINKHYHHESNDTGLLVYWYGHFYDDYQTSSEESYGFSLFLNETFEEDVISRNLWLFGRIKSLRGPCNGVFCVVSENDKLALWNPATSKLRPIPSPPLNSAQVSRADIGFGTDPVIHEFKIVLIHGKSNIGPFFAIYTSSNNSWRYSDKESCLDSDTIVAKAHCGTRFLNGFYYWMKYNNKTCNSVILAFDMHNEVFQEIELPECIRPREDGELALYHDSLALFSYDKNAVKECIDIWVMKEIPCWTKFFTVVLPFEMERPLGFWKSNKIFVSTSWAQKLMVYDIDSQETKNLEVEKGYDVHTNSVWTFHYKESLTSVKGMHGTQDYDISNLILCQFFYPYGRTTS